MAGHGHAAAGEQAFTLTIAPENGAGYAAICTARLGGQDTVMKLSGTRPITRDIIADALSCEVSQTTQTGRLFVEIRGPSGNRSRSRTGGAGSRIVVSVGQD